MELNEHNVQQERVKKKMCKIISKLKGKTADEILFEAGQLTLVPVDITKACRELGFRIISVDFKDIENKLDELVKKRGNILGAVMIQNNEAIILNREDDSLNRKRFTIAHELAHCCLHIAADSEYHIEFRTDEESCSKQEIQANIFAGELLIPEGSLRAIIKNKITLSMVDLYALSNIFQVSVNVMLHRLEILNIETI